MILPILDHLLVCKFYYGIKIPFINKFIVRFNSPKRGDVIVFVFPLDRSKDFIKRVIGLPGDEIEIINKQVYINGKPYSNPHAFYSDPYIYPKIVSPRDNFGPVVVPKDKYFVMGDNRDRSYDSRFWGFVDRRYIEGKAFIIYWSWERPFVNIRWSRIGNVGSMEPEGILNAWTKNVLINKAKIRAIKIDSAQSLSLPFFLSISFNLNP